MLSSNRRTQESNEKLEMFEKIGLDPKRETWKHEEVMSLMEPLVHLPTRDWKASVADKRLQVLLMLGIPDSIMRSQLMRKVEEYNSWMANISECPNIRDVIADELVGALRPLTLERRARWTKIMVDKAVEALIGVSSVDLGASSAEATSVYLAFRADWEIYLDEHPAVKAKMDPVYLVIDLNGGPIPVLPQIPAQSPQPPIVHLNGRGYAFRFANETDATHYAGIFKQSNPNLRLWMFTCAQNCVYW